MLYECVYVWTVETSKSKTEFLKFQIVKRFLFCFFFVFWRQLATNEKSSRHIYVHLPLICECMKTTNGTCKIQRNTLIHIRFVSTHREKGENVCMDSSVSSGPNCQKHEKKIRLIKLTEKKNRRFCFGKFQMKFSSFRNADAAQLFAVATRSIWDFCPFFAECICDRLYSVYVSGFFFSNYMTTNCL